MKRTLLVATLFLGSSICSQSFGFDLLDRMLGLKGSGSYSSCCDTANGHYGQPACGCETACAGACGDVCEPACGLEAPCGDICEPACGLEAPCGCGDICEPACGLEAPCGCGDICEPACGLEASYGSACAPACGCETTVGCDSVCCGSKGGLLNRLFSGGLLNHRHHASCDSLCGDACQPACGVESACGPACGPVCGCEVAVGCDSGCCQSKRPRLLDSLFGHLRGNRHCDSGCDAGCCDGIGTSGAPVYTTPAPADNEEAAPMPPAPTVDPSAHLQSKRRVIQASASYIR